LTVGGFESVELTVESSSNFCGSTDIQVVSRRTVFSALRRCSRFKVVVQQVSRFDKVREA
jgi:hypothetical protein